jgi:tetratricopeptide (TPR) repeat protein
MWHGARHIVAVGVLLSVGVSTVCAAPDPPVRDPIERSPAGPMEPALVEHAESLVNAGLRLAESRQWEAAELAYRDAIRVGRQIPEAWNGLGYVLRQQGRFAEAVAAYDEALRLRPAYSQALEYLGRAYLALGQLAEAREIVTRLRPLNAREADELAQAIAQASRTGATRER